jgi:hypothetical protein
MSQKKQIKSKKYLKTIGAFLFVISIFLVLIWSRDKSLNQKVTEKNSIVPLPTSVASPIGIDKVASNYSMDYILAKTDSFTILTPEEKSQYIFAADAMESGQVFRFRVLTQNHLQPAHNLVNFEYANFIGKDYLVRVMHQPNQECDQALREDSLVPYIQAYFKSGEIKNIANLTLRDPAKGKSWEMTDNVDYEFGYVGCFPDRPDMIWRVEILFNSELSKKQATDRAYDILNSFEFTK